VIRLLLAPDGSIVIPNGRGHDVLRLRDGRLERIAGNGRDGFEADGVAATATAVGFPLDAAVLPTATCTSSPRTASAESRPRREPSPRSQEPALTTTAVTAVPQLPRTSMDRSRWRSAPSGDVFIAEARGRIPRVDASTGLISTFAGVGRRGSGGDGSPAVHAFVEEPAGIAVAADGTIFVAYLDGRRIRRVARDGRVTTVGR
jgi:hypothetical protein